MNSRSFGALVRRQSHHIYMNNNMVIIIGFSVVAFVRFSDITG
jgi:hypothetical protein